MYERCILRWKYIKKKIRRRLYDFLIVYGKEDNKNKLVKETLLTCFVATMILVFNQRMFPKVISEYFCVLGLGLIYCSLSMFFYRKKENAKNWKKLKIVNAITSYFVFGIILIPAFIIIGTFDLFANLTDKIYILRRNLDCCIIEMAYHILFVLTIIYTTTIYAEDDARLFILYFLFILIDKGVCQLIRIVFINRENKYYERYKYKNEMSIISEYVFLGTASISIIVSTTQYENVLIPFLLWYSMKQIGNYRNEKKNSRIDKQYLNKLLLELEEIEEVYIETQEGEFQLSNYIDYNKVMQYKTYISKKTKIFFLSKKRIEKTLNLLINILSKKYFLPNENKKIREDIHSVLNSLVHCL